MFSDPIKKFLYEVARNCFHLYFDQLEEYLEENEFSAMFAFNLDDKDYGTNVKHFENLVNYFQASGFEFFNYCTRFGFTDWLYLVDIGGFTYMVCLRTHNNDSAMEKTHEFYLFPVTLKLTDDEEEPFYINAAKYEIETSMKAAISKDETSLCEVLHHYEGGCDGYDPIGQMFHKNLMVITRSSMPYLTAQRFLVEGQ